MTPQEKIIVLYLADGKYQLSVGVTLMDACIRAKIGMTEMRRYSWENDPTYIWENNDWVVRNNLEVKTAISLYRDTINNASETTRAAIVGEISTDEVVRAAQAKELAEKRQAAVQSVQTAEVQTTTTTTPAVAPIQVAQTTTTVEATPVSETSEIDTEAKE